MEIVKFKIGGDGRKTNKYIQGRIIKEYKHFLLIETENGYKECINKAFIKNGDIKRVI